MTDGAPEVYLCQNLVHRIIKAESQSGLIYGFQTDENFECVDISQFKNDYILHGLSLIGYFFQLDASEKFSSDEYADNELAHYYCTSAFIEEKELENSFLAVVACIHTHKIKAAIYTCEDKKFVPLKVHVEDDFLSDIFLFRARCTIPLMFEGSENIDKQIKSVRSAVAEWRSLFQKNIPVFYSESSRTVLRYQSVEDESLRDFFKRNRDDDQKERKTKKKTISNLEKDPMNFEVLLQTTGQYAVENTANHSLVIYRYCRDFTCVQVPLPVDVIVVSKGSEPLYSLYDLFIEAIDQILESTGDYLAESNKGMQFPNLEVFYFYPYRWTLPIRVLYPKEHSEDELLPYRKNIKSILLDSSKQPLFRRVNRYLFSDEAEPSPYLINPHLGLPPSGVAGGEVEMVNGRYIYYHYMQDHMNDDGWGCAYRSLQTIFSYFRLQGYTDKRVPTHKEIQQALVEIGDKEASFVGSRQWIGSQEVSYCLDHFLKVPCKTVCINSGEDLVSQGHVLLYHFREHGAPVMIGGGVLAHTIIGVHFNHHSGEIKFLVLDPHYTGSEDINVVLNKGWCGWKSVTFWDKNAFYNLCLPQCPNMV